MTQNTTMYIIVFLEATMDSISCFGIMFYLRVSGKLSDNFEYIESENMLLSSQLFFLINVMFAIILTVSFE